MPQTKQHPENKETKKAEFIEKLKQIKKMQQAINQLLDKINKELTKEKK
jgi:hypothetical protein